MVTAVTKEARKSRNETLLQPLFAGAIAGNRQAYAALLKEISALARIFVVRKIGDHADVDDLVQEILLSVHKALHTYDAARPCMPWLGAILHYRMADWLRSRYRIAEKGKVPLEEVEEFLFSDVTEEPYTYEYMNKALSSLSESQQAVIRAMYHQDLTVAETGKKLGMNVSAVKVTAHRAYKKLREQLEHK